MWLHTHALTLREFNELKLGMDMYYLPLFSWMHLYIHALIPMIDLATSSL